MPVVEHLAPDIHQILMLLAEGFRIALLLAGRLLRHCLLWQPRMPGRRMLSSSSCHARHRAERRLAAAGRPGYHMLVGRDRRGIGAARRTAEGDTGRSRR